VKGVKTQAQRRIRVLTPFRVAEPALLSRVARLLWVILGSRLKTPHTRAQRPTVVRHRYSAGATERSGGKAASRSAVSTW
jgi:hypothetical protein